VPTVVDCSVFCSEPDLKDPGRRDSCCEIIVQRPSVLDFHPIQEIQKRTLDRTDKHISYIAVLELTKNRKGAHNDPMKPLVVFRKNILWVLLLLAMICVFSGIEDRPSHVQAVMPSMAMGHSDHNEKSMPSSCPMKGALPCCHGNGQVALCQASLCDLCVLSSPGVESTASLSHIQPPALPIVFDSASNQSRDQRGTQSLHPPLLHQSSFFPPVNSPLLI